MEAQFPGMEYDFLRYMGVVAENQRRIQSHYMPYFEQCSRVVDLACGDADFVGMLVERGTEVVGVDSDDKAFVAAQAAGLPVVKQDVFEWLAEQPDASFDGVFSAHLIEHLPYPKVIELIEQSYRILQPGGIIVLATPNARSLFSHLEMFYTHFGHITFYHPRLVSFFLDRAGFVEAQFGENLQTASPLLAQAQALLQRSDILNIHLEEPEHHLPVIDLPPVAEPREQTPLVLPDEATEAASQLDYLRVIPPQGRTPLHRLSFAVKQQLTNWLVRPLLDDLVVQIETVLEEERQHWRARVAQERAARTAQMQAHAQETHDLRDWVQQQRDNLHGSLQQLRAALQQQNTVRRSQLSALEDEARLLHQEIHTIVHSLQSLNGAFETFIWARKPNSATDRVETADLSTDIQESLDELADS